MPEPTRGLLDTSVVIDLTSLDPDRLPDESAVAAITLAELAAGPHATNDPDEAARRQDRLQWAASTWEALAFDADAARAYGRVFAAVRTAGRSHRPRLADLLVAATAISNGLPVYTRNAGDFERSRGPRRGRRRLMTEIRGTTTLVGLLGWPTSHSLSPPMQNAGFAALGLDWAYVPLPTPPELPRGCRARARGDGIRRGERDDPPQAGRDRAL